MVETKTQKRKAAARTVAKAVHEGSKISAARKSARATPVSSQQEKGPQVLAKEKDDVNPQSLASLQEANAKLGQKKVDAGKVSSGKKSSTPEAIQSATSVEDDEDDSGFAGQQLVVQLTARQEKKLNDGLKKVKADAETVPANANQAGRKSSVVYIGRIPYGFFENQMRAYFAQFGEVVRLRVSRNKKTAKSKHYAFIEFAHPEVAEIVAETHNNMLMCDRMIKCNVVSSDKVHASMWNGSQRVLKPTPFKTIARKAANAKRSPEQAKARVDRLVSKEKAKRKRLEALGLDYDFGGYEQLRDQSRPKRIKFDA